MDATTPTNIKARSANTTFVAFLANQLGSLPAYIIAIIAAAFVIPPLKPWVICV